MNPIATAIRVVEAVPFPDRLTRAGIDFLVGTRRRSLDSTPLLGVGAEGVDAVGGEVAVAVVGEREGADGGAPVEAVGGVGGAGRRGGGTGDPPARAVRTPPNNAVPGRSGGRSRDRCAVR